VAQGGGSGRWPRGRPPAMSLLSVRWLELELWWYYVPTGGDLRKAVTPPITRIDEQHRLRTFSLATELRVLWRNRGRGHGRRTSQKEKADSQNWSGMKRIGATAPKKPEPLAKKYETPSVGASCATLRMPMTASQRSARISKKPQWCHTRIVPKAMLVPSTDASSNRPSLPQFFHRLR